MFVRKDNVGRLIGRVGDKLNYGGICAGGPRKRSNSVGSLGTPRRSRDSARRTAL